MLKKVSLALICATTIIANGLNINLNTVKANDSKLIKYKLIDVAEGVEPVLYESNVYNFCENTVDRTGMLSTRSDDGHDYDLSWNVSPFSNGLAPAYKEGKFGYINSSGEIAIPFEYDVAFQFNEDGKAMVGIDPEPGVNDYAGVHYFDMQFGYINKDGKIVEPISKHLEVLEDSTYNILEYDKNLPNRIQERMLNGLLNRRMSRALSIGAVTIKENILKMLKI